jgi:hypothetical protein
MAFEAPKATPQGMEHRYGQFRIVTILDQFSNDLTLLGDVTLAFGNVPISLVKYSRCRSRFMTARSLTPRPYCFGETRVATVALLIFTVFSRLRSCGIVTAKFSDPPSLQAHQCPGPLPLASYQASHRELRGARRCFWAYIAYALQHYLCCRGQLTAPHKSIPDK